MRARLRTALLFLLLLAVFGGRRASIDADGSVVEDVGGAASSAGRPRRAPRAGPRRVAPLSLSPDLMEEASLFSLSDLAPVASPGGAAGPILPPLTALQLPPSVKPIALAVAPFRRAVLVGDGAVYPNNAYAVPLVREKDGWLLSLLRDTLGYKQPFPVCYLLSPAGATLRTLEFVDRAALARGLAESERGDIGFTFYANAGVEVWDPSLCVGARSCHVPPAARPAPLNRRPFPPSPAPRSDTKFTFHELGLKPAHPVYDAAGVLWVPYTIADRMHEEGEGATMVWAYKADGSKWERFARRMFLGVRFASSLHFDGLGRLAVAGMSNPWAWEDGLYGPEDKAEGGGTCRLEFYTLSGERSRQEFKTEQRARWHELNPGAGGEPTAAEAAAAPLAAALLLEATFAFPWARCLHPLFVLTGDGHAVAACKGEGRLKVLRVGYPVPAAGAPEAAAAARAGASLRGAGRPGPPREAWAPPPPRGTLVRLLPSNASHLLADLAAPYGIGDVQGLAMDPTGAAFLVLDGARGRVVSLPWPWGPLGGGVGAGEEDGDVGPPPQPRAPLWEAPDLGPLTPVAVPPPPKSW